MSFNLRNRSLLDLKAFEPRDIDAIPRVAPERGGRLARYSHITPRMRPT